MKYLELKQVSKSFGGLMAVSNVSLDIEKNSLTGLIGPNGAGKTTLFNLLTGIYPLSEGDIVLHKDKTISLKKLKAYQISRLGIARTFQNIRLFQNMSVIDNVKTALSRKTNYSLLASLLRLPKFLNEEKRIEDEALSLLKLVELENLKDELAKNLAYGKQRELEIIRALATGGDILFLDEPAAGMNHSETEALMSFISKIRDTFDLTIVLIEHDMNLVMRLCEMIYVLDYGKLIASGTPSQIKNNKRVIEAYLGDGDV